MLSITHITYQWDILWHSENLWNLSRYLCISNLSFIIGNIQFPKKIRQKVKELIRQMILFVQIRKIRKTNIKVKVLSVFFLPYSLYFSWGSSSRARLLGHSSALRQTIMHDTVSAVQEHTLDEHVSNLIDPFFWMETHFKFSCFALTPQAIFPAHNLNFHWRWWDRIQAIF